ncbi:hypothetical protein F0562_019714 [Nyssa sinensis]|uniref:Uncharacterized protein n=1 Tax=Nyssa sinensis TaxID=561372 RepID=A0A5J5BUE0_9ASTE|nr:hypothetical protein F0562_019714 [Nyssa sinensis]
MRIRKFSMNSVSAVATTHSIASSIDSSSSARSHSSTSPTRCEGLDLLVKAIHHVSAGSVVGVPYIQRKVIRRRRRALRFNKLVITELFKREEEEEDRENEGLPESNSMSKRQRRVMALPSKYQDSVLQPWKPYLCKFSYDRAWIEEEIPKIMIFAGSKSPSAA